LSFSSSGIGSGTHYAGERFKLAAKIDALHIPYKGTPEALNDAVGGRVQYTLSSVLPAVPLIKSGRLLAFAVTTPLRAVPLPDVPTVAELGLPDAECDGWYGAFVQSRTPRSIVMALSREIGRILDLPEVQEKIIALGATVKHSTPDVFDAMVSEEIVLRRKIFGASGAKAQ
jgi:tripartite-type tricarboxylate transporter receptor subunit TctC